MDRYELPIEDTRLVYQLAAGLGALAKTQSIVSKMVPDALPKNGEGPTKDQVRTYFMCMMVETMELMNELNWKPWKKDREIDVSRVVDEFADVLAFLGVILNYLEALGISEADLARAYQDKSQLNVHRFKGKVEGYGVGGA